jgi:hypothetical protein
MTDPAFLLGAVIVVVASFMLALEIPRQWVRRQVCLRC